MFGAKYVHIWDASPLEVLGGHIAVDSLDCSVQQIKTAVNNSFQTFSYKASDLEPHELTFINMVGILSNCLKKNRTSVIFMTLYWFNCFLFLKEIHFSDDNPDSAKALDEQGLGRCRVILHL